jgi:hypothetical protein
MRRRSIGRTAGCYPDNAGSTPAVAAPFLGRLIGRIFGSEPKDAWFESRPRSSYGRGHGVHAVSNTAGEGSIPSVRAQHTSGMQCIVRDARGCGRRPALPAGRPTSSDRCATQGGGPWGNHGVPPRLPRSSSRPGCRSLTPVTRVRVPLGALLDATVVSGRKHTALPAPQTGFDPRRSLSLLFAGSIPRSGTEPRSDPRLRRGTSLKASASPPQHARGS